MDRPVWKSRQAAHASGVTRSGGANSCVQEGQGLDWSKWTGAIHLSPVEQSEQDMTGIKYCPGGELPVYRYVEYKPRFSKKRNTTFVYVTDVEEMPKAL